MPGDNSKESCLPRSQSQDLSPIPTFDLGKVESQTASEKVDQENGNVDSWKMRVDPRIIADSILGLSDGLTVPFALTAGLTEFGSTSVVVLGGLAELIAGAISMGLGGYVGAKSERESYQSTLRNCTILIQQKPQQAKTIIRNYFEEFGVQRIDRIAICDKLMSSPDDARTFLMKHHFKATEPPSGRPYISALALGVSYFAGGFLPLIPYFFVPKRKVIHGLYWSSGLMVLVLLVFGFVKTCIVRGWRGRENLLAGLKGAAQMLVVGALAAGAAVGLVRLVNIHHRMQTCPS